MAAREGSGKGGVKGGEAMMANKIAGSVGSVPAMCPREALLIWVVVGIRVDCAIIGA